MRNLKRALSLGLTAAMISGLMVMGSSAVSYNDSESIQNQTAVEILGEIGAMVGDDQGNFNPDQDVTRAEMAVIITRILYGNNLNVDQFKGMNIFSDVPSWAEGFVNLCASLDIVAGVGGDKFDPNATVTTAQASLMLSRALGYFQNTAEFGNDWALSAVRRATQVGIIGGDMVLQANEGLSRDDVAQMTFNTLTKAVPVQYNELLDVYYNENKGITYSLTFYYTDTLGYQNFDLVYRSNDRGDYGRPSTTWGTGSYRSNSATSVGNDDYGLNEDGSLKPELVNMLEEDEIITVAEEPTYVYTEATKNSDVYKDLGRSLVEDDEWTWEAYVDGTEQRDPVLPTNTSGTYAYTTDGAVTELYVDDVNKEITVVQINYYMGEVTDIDEDENGEYATVRVLSKNTDDLSDVVDERDIYCEGFAEDDYVVVTVDVNDDGDSFIASIDYPDTVEGTVTRVHEDSEPEDSEGSYVKLEDDVKHEYSSWTASDLDDINENHPTLDAQYRLYLDPNGFVIGFIALENIYDNYLYIEEADTYLGTIEAKATFSDGRSEVITIDDEYVDGSDVITAGNWAGEAYTDGGLEGGAYAYSESNGVYTLRQILYMGVDRTDAQFVDTMFEHYKDVAQNVTAGAEINNNVAYITVGGTRYIVDQNTQFVDVNEGVAYTGYENVPDYVPSATNDVKFWVIDTREGNDVLDVVFIYEGESSNDNKTYFYVPDASAFETYNENSMYKGLEVTIDAQEETLDFTQAAFNTVRAHQEGLYCVERTNGDGYVTEVTYLGDGMDLTLADNEFQIPEAVGAKSFSLDPNQANQWIVNDETLFVHVVYDLKTGSNTDYKEAVVKVGDLKDMEADEDYWTSVYVAKPSDTDDPAELVYIVDVEIPEGAGTQIRDGRATFTTNVNRMGVLSVALDYDRANYMDAASNVNVTFNISANGEYVATRTLTVLGGHDTAAGKYGLGLLGDNDVNYLFAQDDDIDIDVVSAMPARVYVNYVDTDGHDVNIQNQTYATMTTGAGADFWIKPNTDEWVNNFSVASIAGATYTSSAPADITDSTAITTGIKLSGAKADGDGFVTIVLNMSGADARTFSITQDASESFSDLFDIGHTIGGITNGAVTSSDMLVIAPSKTAGIALGDDVDFEIGLPGGVAEAGIKAYQVTLTIGDASRTVTLSNQKMSETVSLPINADVVLGRANIKVEAIKTLSVVKSEVSKDDKTITITFSKAVTGVKGITATKDGTNNLLVKVAGDGTNVVTIRATGENTFAAGNTVKIPVTVTAVDTTYGADAMTASTLTVSGSAGSLTIA